MGGCEQRYGVEIAESVNAGDENRNRYEITPVHHLRFITRYLKKSRINKNDRIFDVGCGKGAMLWYFITEIGFKEASGLERSDKLCSICRSNIEKWDINAKVINGDASEFEDYDEYNYFYLYNPFDATIMRKFICCLEQSISRRPRTTTILYVCSLFKGIFEEHGWKSVSEYKKNIFHTKESTILCKEVQEIQ